MHWKFNLKFKIRTSISQELDVANPPFPVFARGYLSSSSGSSAILPTEEQSLHQVLLTSESLPETYWSKDNFDSNSPLRTLSICQIIYLSTFCFSFILVRRMISVDSTGSTINKHIFLLSFRKEVHGLIDNKGFILSILPKLFTFHNKKFLLKFQNAPSAVVHHCWVGWNSHLGLVAFCWFTVAATKTPFTRCWQLWPFASELPSNHQQWYVSGHQLCTRKEYPSCRVNHPFTWHTDIWFFPLY